jgi:hypothetical protein
MGDTTASIGALEAYHQIQKIERIVNITGNGPTTLNVFKFTGAVRIVHQEAIITSVTDLTTCTNAYATLYDGTNTVNLTADGVDLSGALPWTYFVKDKVAAQTYSMCSADQVRLLEVSNSIKAGLAFTAIGKSGVDNYIQFNFTGDANTDFNMFVHFEYITVNGSTLELA